MRRTSHIAVRVPEDRVEEAVDLYTALLGLTRENGDGDIALKGENFTIYIDVDSDPKVVLQEFAGSGAAVEMQKFLNHGCEVFDVSTHGFHVRDPFGMCYHVWIERDGAGPD